LERFCRLQQFTVPKITAPPPTVDRAGAGIAAAVATLPAVTTKQQEFDDDLNYGVTIARWKFGLLRLGVWFVLQCLPPGFARSRDRHDGDFKAFGFPERLVLCFEYPSLHVSFSMQAAHLLADLA
jgi:hypothetical protein